MCSVQSHENVYGLRVNRTLSQSFAIVHSLGDLVLRTPNNPHALQFISGITKFFRNLAALDYIFSLILQI